MLIKRNLEYRWIGLWLLTALFISSTSQAIPCADRQDLFSTVTPAEKLDRSLRRYQPLVEKSIAYRQASLELADEVKRSLDTGRPMSGRQLEELKLGTRAHL
ncbi:MAG: hypothetical protein KZQ77_19725, partial [Candidatus Thiodiazotropha sp. (ex Notomyrtea botanica)]|nr:hypothetical protein [Candidatus Thiodiazotropha sp. (ex Notomyrtea botanica)]